jgi:hypothetical protein
MSETDHASTLTGVWSGEYWYDEVADERAPFAAHITESSSHIAGTTLELATFDGLTGDLTSQLNGERQGTSVRFTKLYDPAPGLHQLPIDYIGEANDELTAIEGYWIMFEPEPWRGRFRMSRVATGAKLAIQRASAEPATIDPRN